MLSSHEGKPSNAIYIELKTMSMLQKEKNSSKAKLTPPNQASSRAPMIAANMLTAATGNPT